MVEIQKTDILRWEIGSISVSHSRFWLLTETADFKTRLGGKDPNGLKKESQTKFFPFLSDLAMNVNSH